MEVGEGCCGEHSGVGGGGAELMAWVRGCEESGWLACSDAKANGPRAPRCFFWRGWLLISFSFLPWVMSKMREKGRGSDFQGIRVPRSPTLDCVNPGARTHQAELGGSLLCPPPALWPAWSQKQDREAVCFLFAPGMGTESVHFSLHLAHCLVYRGVQKCVMVNN